MRSDLGFKTVPTLEKIYFFRIYMEGIVFATCPIYGTKEAVIIHHLFESRLSGRTEHISCKGPHFINVFDIKIR